MLPAQCAVQRARVGPNQGRVQRDVEGGRQQRSPCAAVVGRAVFLVDVRQALVNGLGRHGARGRRNIVELQRQRVQRVLLVRGIGAESRPEERCRQQELETLLHACVLTFARTVFVESSTYLASTKQHRFNLYV